VNKDNQYPMGQELDKILFSNPEFVKGYNEFSQVLFWHDVKQVLTFRLGIHKFIRLVFHIHWGSTCRFYGITLEQLDFMERWVL